MALHYAIQEGATDVIIMIKWLNKSDGTSATTVDYNSAGISVNYVRRGFDDAAIALADGTDPDVADDAHSDGQMIHVYNGVCRLDLPDAVCASGLASGQKYIVISGESDDFEMVDVVIQLTEGVPGASASSQTSVDDVQTDVDTLLTRLGTPSDLGGGATVAANLSDIESQTDDIGAAGAGLTAADDAILTRLGTPVGASLSADLATLLASQESLKKNVAIANYYVYLQLAADGTPATGVTITTQISKDGGAFANLAAGATSATELGTTGIFKIAIAQAEMNADDIALKFTGTGVAQRVVYIRTQS